MFLYVLTVETGEFEIVKASVVALSPDQRMQALLIAFSFGAFIEGAAGFGTPVAISAALLIGTGFPPLYAAGLALFANTAPVAFGALGTPIITLAKVTGLPEMQLSAMAGRQLPLFSLIVPAWMVVHDGRLAGLRGVWPAVLVCGGSFASVQFLISNFVGPQLADVAGGLVAIIALALMLRIWRPRDDVAIRRFGGASRLRRRRSHVFTPRERASLGPVGHPLCLRIHLGHAAVSNSRSAASASRSGRCRFSTSKSSRTRTSSPAK